MTLSQSWVAGPRTSRRIIFSGLGALGVAAALAGCAGDGGDDDAAAEPGTELAATSEVPVGGGVVLTDQKVVLTQPSEGQFKAFTAVCTHQQLTVTSVADGEIRCANHGSSFSAETGEVQGGPAPSALEEVAIEVRDGRIVRA
ncbi:Rieske (2Fe-2S) protein [Nocardioides sp. SYSU DS0651]|uniref:Rieske (2Fe-2S) protein n=1 Tax=Nocardioides sp. SYSU DS0651 TaxID=3415955 RepID=UPI003F4B86B4